MSNNSVHGNLFQMKRGQRRMVKLVQADRKVIGAQITSPYNGGKKSKKNKSECAY